MEKKKIEKKQMREYKVAFESYRKLFSMEVEEYYEAQQRLLLETDFRKDISEDFFIDLGINAFLYLMETRHNDWKQMQVNISAAKDIIGDDNDLEEI